MKTTSQIKVGIGPRFFRGLVVCLCLCLCLCLGFFSLSSCKSGSSKPNPEAPASPGLVGTMHELKNSLSRLLPAIIDLDQYNDPKKQDFIIAEVKSLVLLSKQVTHSTAVARRDPSMRFISNAFLDDLEKAEESLLLGKREYARYSLLNVTAYCIECHTRTSTGPSFASQELENTLKKVGRLERGEYLLAVRQFDQALEEFMSLIKEKLIERNDFFVVDKAVRYALAVTVKFKSDPKKSLEIVDLIEKSAFAPYYLKQNAAGWKAALKEWQKEKVSSNSGRNSGSNASSLASIKERLGKAADLVKQGSRGGLDLFNKSGDIYFLRALSTLHLLMESELSTKLNKDQLGQALYLMGFCYEAVKDLSISTLHESYYESCIGAVAHSPWSKKCYNRLEESLFFGFTGSGGSRIPADVQKKLEGLRSLAN